tara:strand:- start:291 stop:1415 length:1125 start_codon:yes stop_codon:yes gene_type:complete
MSNKLIRLSKSCIGAAEKEAVMNVLDNEYLGMGQKVKDFEDLLSEYFGRPALCVVNGTAALHLALQAVGVGQGDEVLVPSITYVASYQAISATGAIPVSCDIDPDSFCLDLDDACERVTDRTRAIMPVHYAGGTGALDGYYAMADKYGLRVIEDSAHALGSSYSGKLIGSFGDVACFSFDGIKNITSGEGGCIVTDDSDVLERVKDARLLGVINDTEARFKGARTWKLQVENQGWRYHMSDIMAAIGSVQFNRKEEFFKKRQILAERYCLRFKNIDAIKPIISNFDSVVPHIYVVRILKQINRDDLRKKLLDKKIETGVHYQPNHLLNFFECSNIAELKNTMEHSENIISLPLHADLNLEDVDYVADNLIQLLE